MDLIVGLTVGLMIARIGYNIISGYLSTNPKDKAALKRFLGINDSKNRKPNK